MRGCTVHCAQQEYNKKSEHPEEMLWFTYRLLLLLPIVCGFAVLGDGEMEDYDNTQDSADGVDDGEERSDWKWYLVVSRVVRESLHFPCSPLFYVLYFFYLPLYSFSVPPFQIEV